MEKTSGFWFCSSWLFSLWFVRCDLRAQDWNYSVQSQLRFLFLFFWQRVWKENSALAASPSDPSQSLRCPPSITSF